MNFGAHLIPQLNPQTSAAKFKLKTRVSLFLGLELKSGSCHLIWPSQLTALSRTRAWAISLGRWICIARPVFAYPFADLILSWPFDQNRAAQRRRPPRNRPLARVRFGSWQGDGSAAMRRIWADFNGPLRSI